MPMKKLDNGDRTFFDQIRTSTFENPFGESRLASDKSAAGVKGDVNQMDVLDQLLGVLASRLEKIAAGRTIDIRDYAADDRERLQIALLFHIFHHWRDRPTPTSATRSPMATSSSPGRGPTHSTARYSRTV